METPEGLQRGEPMVEMVAPRAAIYVRVSTDSDAQRDSPLHQVQTCREYAESIGLMTCDELIYSDAGLSGTELEQRAEVRRLLADARLGRFEAVLFTAISRFSRDLSDAFSMKKKLELVYGIRLISIEEGYDTQIDGRNNEMVFTVHAMLAAHKSKEMSLAIRRGRRQSARRGRHTGNHSPYGYQKTKEKQLKPDPMTAPIVQQIFEWYRSGASTRQIAARLNQGRIPTARQLQGRELSYWQSSTVHAILRNEVYVGRIVANRWTKKVDVEQSRHYDRKVQKVSLRSKGDWVVVEDAHPPIIPNDLFELVQARLHHKEHSVVKTGSGSNLLSRVVVCGDCGSAMVMTGNHGFNATGEVRRYRYLVCSRAKRVGRKACANHHSIPYPALVQALLDTLQDMLRKEPQLELLTSRPADTQVEPQITDAGIQVELHRIELELQHNKQRQRENLRAYQEGLFEHGLIAEAQKRLLEEAKGLERDYASLRQRELAALAQFPVIPDGLWDAESTQAWPWLHWLLTTLIERVVVPASGDIEVYLAFSSS